MVPKKETEQKPAKYPFSTRPEHHYQGVFDDLPIAPEERPENGQDNFPSTEDIEFDGEDLIYLKEVSKGKVLRTPRTAHARNLFAALYASGWTKNPVKIGFDISIPIDFSFIEGCRYLTAYYQWHLPLMDKELDEPSKTKVYGYLNYLDRHIHALLKELEVEKEMVYHIEDGDLNITEEELKSGKPVKLENRKYIRESRKEKLLENFLLKEKGLGGYHWSQGVSGENKQLVPRLLEDLKSFQKYLKIQKEEIDRAGLNKGRPSDPYAVSTMAGVIELFNDFKMDRSAWELTEDARWNRAGVRAEEFQSDLFKVVSIIFKTAGRPRIYINNIWKSYQKKSVPHPRYPFSHLAE